MVCQLGTPDRADHLDPCAKIFAEILTKRYLSKTQVEESQVPFEGGAYRLKRGTC